MMEAMYSQTYLRRLSGFSTTIRMHEWPRNQANLYASEQIISARIFRTEHILKVAHNSF